MNLSIFELSGIDFAIFVLLFYVIYKVFFKKRELIQIPTAAITPLKKQNLTVEQLRRYDGVQEENICLALFGKIYDVTRGKDFYGPEGPYGNLAGHDATRALATMDVNNVKDEYDDISDLSPTEIEDANEWAIQLSMKYPVVGRLLAPGEIDFNEDLNSSNNANVETDSNENLKKNK